jgi:polyisoprenoid-binding protein YceI
MKTILASIIAVIIIGGGLFLYQTRPTAAPTTDINTEVEHLDTTDATAGTTDTTAIKTLRIVGAESKATFSLNEVLNGTPTLVVGTTSQVAGDIQISATAPAKLTIGEIKIDARTLKTDNERRNGALGRLILKSDQTGNEYITFKTTAITGLPDTIETDKAFSYTIAGDMTVRGVTKPVTFKTTNTFKADGSFVGSADTTIAYADFGISIPDLSFLANVDKTTKLSISIVAK